MRRAFYLLLIGLAIPALPRKGLDRHAWTDSTEVRTRNFIVETNTFPELGTQLGAHLERAYPFFEDRFGPLKGRARRPMRMSLFRTRSEYYLHGDGVKGAVGHFDSALDRCAIVWRGETGARGWPVAVHEACHNYLRRRHPHIALPSWYSEGIACYFEGVLDAGSPRSVARLRLRAAKAAYEAGDAKLDLVLLTKARVARGQLMLQNFAPRRFYGLSWSLVHFLASDSRYTDAFRRFELRLFAARGTPGTLELTAKRLLEEECGTLGDIERDWRTWLERLPGPRAHSTAPVYAWELSSPKPFVRYCALRRIERGKTSADLMPGVLACLRDRDIAVRTQACRVAAGRMSTAAVQPMVEALDLGDPELKRAALRGLASPYARAAVERLMDERTDRAAALRALATIGDPRAYPVLRAGLADVRFPATTRAKCAASLADDPRAITALTEALTDREALVRSAARIALDAGKRAAPAQDSVEAISSRPLAPRVAARHLDVLADASAASRDVHKACRMLALARDERAVPLLRRLCRPQVADHVRLEAVRALVRITGETKGYAPGQKPSARERVYRAWSEP